MRLEIRYQDGGGRRVKINFRGGLLVPGVGSDFCLTCQRPRNSVDRYVGYLGLQGSDHSIEASVTCVGLPWLVGCRVSDVVARSVLFDRQWTSYLSGSSFEFGPCLGGADLVRLSPAVAA